MKDCRGVALVEVMIALGLFSIVVSSVWVVVFQRDRFLVSGQVLMEDLLRATEVLERYAFISFISHTKADPSPYVLPCMAQVATTSEQLLIADVAEVRSRGGDCGGYFSWFRNIAFSSHQNTERIGNIIGATGVDLVKHNIAVSFVSDDVAAPDIALGRVDSRGMVTDIQTLDTGVLGINSIDATRDVIFAAQRDPFYQLAVVRAGAQGLNLVASTTLPGVAGQYPEGWSIFYYDNRLYVGTKRTAGHEFHVFDVSNPHNPVWRGSKEINHNVNGIAVKNGRAFLATSGNARDLIVLDVSDPAAILKIAELDVLGGEDGKSVAIVGNTLYLGRVKSNRGNPDFIMIDIQDVFAGGAARVLSSYTVGGDVNTIRVAHQYAFLGTSQNGGEMTVLDVSSSTRIQHHRTVPVGQKVTAMDYQDNVLVLSVFGSEGFVTLLPHES